MLKKLLNGIVAGRSEERRAEMYRNLIRHEAKIGGQLFGPVPAGGRREFFCLDKTTWVWHEEWIDQNRQHQMRATRYDVRPNGILKAQNGQYQSVTPDEAKKLYQAAKLYTERVKNELYSFAA
ncbi:hypothetical protein H0X10_02990 [Candidatus Saccharibacteria bacterium]|nr:hypothetical protein [Candidatus Saccharibacteria bacterium]